MWIVELVGEVGFGGLLGWIPLGLLGCALTGRSPLLVQMRDVLKTEELDIPEGVTVDIKSRIVTVSGPRGTLKKNLRHIDMDIRLQKGKTNKVSLAVWQGGRKHVAWLRTIRSLIVNMITGVTKVRTLAFKMHGPLNQFSCGRASNTRCAPSTPISPSTASFRIMVMHLKSVTSWARRFVTALGVQSVAEVHCSFPIDRAECGHARGCHRFRVKSAEG